MTHDSFRAIVYERSTNEIYEANDVATKKKNIA